MFKQSKLKSIIYKKKTTVTFNKLFQTKFNNNSFTNYQEIWQESKGEKDQRSNELIQKR